MEQNISILRLTQGLINKSKTFKTSTEFPK